MYLPTQIPSIALPRVLPPRAPVSPPGEEKGLISVAAPSREQTLPCCKWSGSPGYKRKPSSQSCQECLIPQDAGHCGGKWLSTGKDDKPRGMGTQDRAEACGAPSPGLSAGTLRTVPHAAHLGTSYQGQLQPQDLWQGLPSHPCQMVRQAQRQL